MTDAQLENWPIHPAILLFGFVFCGMGIFGIGYDFSWYGGRRLLGLPIAAIGIAMMCYGLFWPLAFGGY